MPQPEHISVLPVPDPKTLDGDLQALFAVCRERLGICLLYTSDAADE